MTPTTALRRRRRPTITIAAAAAALALTACSSGIANSADSGGDVPVSITKAVEAAKAPVTEWSGPTEAFTPPPGKKLTILSCGSAATGCVLASKAAGQAAEALGWRARIIDGKLDPNVWNSAARQTATDQQDALLLITTNPALMQDGLSKVREAGIPTVLTFQPKLADAPEVDGYVTTDHAAGGTLLGDFIIQDSGGDANVLVLDAPEYPEGIIRNNAVVAELEKSCPDCTVRRQEFSAATMVERLAGQVSSLLQQDPGITHVYTPFDATGTFVAQGIRLAGKSGTVKLVSAEGALDAFGRVKSGEQAASLAGSPGYTAWLGVDMLARILAGRDTEQVMSAPQRLIVQDNVDDVIADGSWQLEIDYKSEFRKLWGK